MSTFDYVTRLVGQPCTPPWRSRSGPSLLRSRRTSTGTRPPPTTSAPSPSPWWLGPPRADCRRLSSRWLQAAGLLSSGGGVRGAQEATHDRCFRRGAVRDRRTARYRAPRSPAVGG